MAAGEKEPIMIDKKNLSNIYLGDTGRLRNANFTQGAYFLDPVIGNV